ncbi:MAG TPA: SbcC/MukB-like Walker B domain-containing protein, partial [Gemmatimonadales bacterium]|nr:SbcC/MukB-like Walker B domain-containing protein [Gemmatimonadales bacterium]
VALVEDEVDDGEHGAEAAREQFSRLDRELAEALAAKTRLDELLPALEPLAALRVERERLDAERDAAGGRLSLEARRTEVLRQLERVEQRLGRLPPREEIDRAAAARLAVQAALEQAVQAAEARRTAWVRDKQDAETQRKTLLAQYEDLQEQRRRLEEAGPGGDCPICARPLGSEYEHVLAVLVAQIEDVESNGKHYRQRIEQLKHEPAELAELVRERGRLDQQARSLTGQVARLEQQAAERVGLEADRALLTAQVAELGEAIARAPERYDTERHALVKARIAELEPKAYQAERLKSGAERAEELVRRAAEAEHELSRRETAARELRGRLDGLGWSAQDAERVKTRLREAERGVQQAEVGMARAAGELTAALGHRAEVARRREEYHLKAAEIQRLGDEVLLQHELDRAFGDLRTDLNNTLRPDLSDLASGFLRELTAGRYTDFELDEDYVATIVDDGEPKPVISGGEEDVASLALRLAISQMIAERAGQPLSLLVLDEIFGSLDEEHRGAVLDLLRNLADRFPQVILITHIESVREGFDRVIRLSYDVEQGVARAVDETPAEAAGGVGGPAAGGEARVVAA